MDYKRNYLTLVKAMRASREDNGRPVSRKAAGGLGSRVEQALDMGETSFDPLAYMRDIEGFLDDNITESDFAPTESLRPKARPDSEETLGLDDGVSLRPQSRGEALTTDIGVRLMGDLMDEFGLTKEQAAAFVGNLAQETGDFKFMQEIDPVVEGSKGGWGFAQWTGQRRKNFEAWAEANDLDPASYEANWGYLKKELTEADDEIQNMGINTISGLKDIYDLEEATKFISNSFLKPGKPNIGRRISKASGYMEF